MHSACALSIISLLLLGVCCAHVAAGRTTAATPAHCEVAPEKDPAKFQQLCDSEKSNADCAMCMPHNWTHCPCVWVAGGPTPTPTPPTPPTPPFPPAPPVPPALPFPTGPFGGLHKGVNLDVSSPDSGMWMKSQYEPAQMQAIAEAGFESVRVFMPYAKNINDTQAQIDDALSNNLSIIVCMWGLPQWSRNYQLGKTDIAQRWGQLASLWKHYPSKLIFEIMK
eukprot:COSAG01_NODE_14621_length_1430_cov_176.319309_2_plen_223_part_00